MIEPTAIAVTITLCKRAKQKRRISASDKSIIHLHDASRTFYILRFGLIRPPYRKSKARNELHMLTRYDNNIHSARKIGERKLNRRTYCAIASAIMRSSAFLSLGIMEHVNGSGRLAMSQPCLFPCILARNSIHLMITPVYLYSC